MYDRRFSARRQRAQTAAQYVAAVVRMILGASSLLLISPAPAAATPFVPVEDSEVLEHLPTPNDAIEPELRGLQTALRAQPGRLDLALRLARQYIGLGRAESDPRYYGYAQAALAAWWSKPNPPVEILVLRGVLRQNRHRFAAALQDLDQALSINPGHPQALLTRAVIYQVQGRYAESADDCRRLPNNVHPLATATCLNAALSLNGEAQSSYERLRQAVVNADHAAPEIRLWALTVLAELAGRLGRLDASERHFTEALALGVRNSYLLGAYADLLLDQGRFEDVADLLSEETQADGLLLRLTLAETRLAGARADDFTAMLKSRFAASRRRGDAAHAREEARFNLELLDRPGEALQLALRNWQDQREPADIRLALEAALASGGRAAAQPVIDWVGKRNLEARRIEALVVKLEKEAG